LVGDYIENFIGIEIYDTYFITLQRIGMFQTVVRVFIWKYTTNSLHYY